MGLISGSIHKRTTQRLVAPTRVVVALSPAQVRQVATSICDSFEPRRGILSKGEKLWIIGTSEQAFSAVYGPPAKNEPNTVVRSWKTDISSTVEAGQTLVQFELTNWKTRDKELVFKKEFEGFRDRFFQRLRQMDPSMRELGSA